MSLTKEECEKAFKRLNVLILSSPFEGDLTDYNDLKKCGTQLQDNFMDDVMVFSQLIDKHFDNPPLKFEELKENMWVWDNHWKLYIQIQNLNENAFQGYEYYAQFEENRFYRREVK